MKIIAEVGSNFHTLEDCLMSIKAAKHSGADAVKFQLFTHEDLYGFHSSVFCLSRSWVPHLKECADKVGIEFMCSAFSPSGYEFINEYVQTHKIASAEMSHVRILETVNKLGRPVLLSTGAHGVKDIQMALQYLKNSHVTLMYCVAAYPTKHVDLECIDNLRRLFQCQVGFSDHTLDVGVIPLKAAQHGATVLEKHFTALSTTDITPDAGHSLNPRQFSKMVKSIRDTDLPRGVLGWTDEEQDMILMHNRRLIATEDIKPGDQLIENDNFGIYRSKISETSAYSPFKINEVNGRQAKRSIKQGEGIGPDCLE